MPWDPVGLSLGTKHPNVSGTARSQGGHGARFVGATREERGFPKRPHVVTGWKDEQKQLKMVFFWIEHYDVSMICSYIFIHFHALFSTKMTWRLSSFSTLDPIFFHTWTVTRQTAPARGWSCWVHSWSMTGTPNNADDNPHMNAYQKVGQCFTTCCQD